MKDASLKEEFILLKDERLSFDKIAKKLKVSKPTLIEWSKEFKTEIEDLKLIRYEEILEKYKATQENRIERIARELELAWKNYESKDYENLSKREILMMIVRLERRLHEETEHIYKTKVNNKNENEPENYKIIVERHTISRDPVTGEIISTPFEEEEKNGAEGRHSQ